MRQRRYQQGCLIRERRKAGPDVWAFRWRDGQVNRKDILGTVEQFPTKSAALKACELLRANINREARSPRTVAELVSHYSKKELSEESGKAYSTREVYGSCLKTWVLPQWGRCLLSGVKAVDVEAWLGKLPLSNGSRAKIRNVMSALFTHAQRYEWSDRNPIRFVRQSAKRNRAPDVLTTEQVGGLLSELPDHCRTAVLLAATTGLRVSELLGLKWSDVDFDKGEIRACRGIVDQVVGNLKTEASQKAIPMDSALASAMLDWRGRCPYNQSDDFLFGSPEMDGRQPYWPDSLLRKVIRPAAVRAGISVHIGWHSFRRTFATLLQANGEPVKVTQELMRHASSRVTMDLYAQGSMPAKRMAQSRVTQAVLNAGG